LQLPPPLPNSKPFTQNRHGTEPMRVTTGKSVRPQISVSSILVSPLRPVTRKLIGCAAF
jgi:hypothetical protein